MQSKCNALNNKREKSIYTEREKKQSKMHGMKLYSAETGSHTLVSNKGGDKRKVTAAERKKKSPELGKTFSHGLNTILRK